MEDFEEMEQKTVEYNGLGNMKTVKIEIDKEFQSEKWFVHDVLITQNSRGTEDYLVIYRKD